MTRHCDKCGAKLYGDSRFCPKCGSPVMGTEQVSGTSRINARRVLLGKWNNTERWLVSGTLLTAALIFIVISALFAPLIQANHGELPDTVAVGSTYVSTVGVIIFLALGLVAIVVGTVAAIKFLARR